MYNKQLNDNWTGDWKTSLPGTAWFVSALVCKHANEEETKLKKDPADRIPIGKCGKTIEQ
ncbi:hypothetical protein B1748_12880 [Paenibacillus sp. MY03]|jgi:hypothetical protein|uniref:Uncharacterized protein n=1 Tax=Paenibacillus agaridevorans TaxID=171404 RepID=A0A2R5EUR8_9BACL|nr:MULTISPECIES: hypothetical protein [Paenibacillus]OUS76156.1 hypothetical protein B1748_12880 [Paenibacillus sp. MY03]GBG07131.1 hypothetical protein PAT3040_01679 [Paenibacillus agaridevorans]